MLVGFNEGELAGDGRLGILVNKMNESTKRVFLSHLVTATLSLMGVHSKSACRSSRLKLMYASGKHFLNDPSSIALSSLRGLCALNTQLALDTANKGM
jgi:hypothetical protein